MSSEGKIKLSELGSLDMFPDRHLKKGFLCFFIALYAEHYSSALKR